MGKKALKYGIFLCVLGLIVGVLLAVVNAITAPKIEEMEKEKVNALFEEYNKAYSTDYEFKENTNIDHNTNVLAIYISNKDDVYAYKAKGLGYGNGEMIFMIYIQNNKIMKVSIVSTSGQTKGIGTQVEDEAYLAKYVGQSVQNYNGIKATAHKAGSIDIISGATYSSRGAISAVIEACTNYCNISKEVTE